MEDCGDKGKLRDGLQSEDVCTEWNLLPESADWEQCDQKQGQGESTEIA